MKQLTHLRGGKKVAEYLLDVPDAIIGRGSSAQIRLDDNTLASRQHCVVRQREGTNDAHTIEDLGGANGTFVNGYKVEVHVLRPGDRVVLGDDTLRYDFATRLAVSLRPTPPPKSELEKEIFDPSATDSVEFEELDLAAMSVISDLKDLREAKKEAVASGVPDSGERTAVAAKGDIEKLLAEALQKSKPHLLMNGEDGVTIVELTKSPMTIGHRKDCDIRLTGFKLFGRLSGEFVEQMGGWCVVPESPFWAPIYQGDDKLEKIRQLTDGVTLEIGGIEFRYSKGEDF
ncbi:MAG: FHA domain-containing protein [Proteobacteria bacterium]|nr:FHA domain-containing protein [Pseudomonadota bacterium]